MGDLSGELGVSLNSEVAVDTLDQIEDSFKSLETIQQTLLSIRETLLVVNHDQLNHVAGLAMAGTQNPHLIYSRLNEALVRSWAFNENIDKLNDGVERAKRMNIADLQNKYNDAMRTIRELGVELEDKKPPEDTLPELAEKSKCPSSDGLNGWNSSLLSDELSYNKTQVKLSQI